MFLQKLSLKSDQSYSTTTSLENILENLYITFKHIPILTPFASSADPIETIKKNIENKNSKSTLTPSMFIENFRLFDCSHVILQDRELFDKFGLNLSQIPRPFIEIGNTENYPLLNLFKFFIKAQNEDTFVVLYILSKLFNGKVVTKKAEKLKIFFKVFKIEWPIISYDELTDEQLECIVFMDGYVDNSSERIFCIGNNNPSRFNNLKIDLYMTGKFKPRIGELYRAITPAIVKGHKEFDYDRFANISK